MDRTTKLLKKLLSSYKQGNKYVEPLLNNTLKEKIEDKPLVPSRMQFPGMI
jgi:hypothetical protein